MQKAVRPLSESYDSVTLSMRKKVRREVPLARGRPSRAGHLDHQRLVAHLVPIQSIGRILHSVHATSIAEIWRCMQGVQQLQY